MKLGYTAQTVFGLLILGLIFLASSSQIYSKDVYSNPYHLTLLQIGWILLGIFGFSFFYFFDYKKMKYIAYLLFITSTLFLMSLAIFGAFPCESNIPFSPCIKGARRWMYLNPPPLPALPFIGVLGFQPSEFAKLAVILYLSFQLDFLIRKGKEAFWVYLFIAGLTSGLIMLQPNMSTAVMVFTLATIIYYSSGAPVKKLFYLAPVLLILGITLIIFSPYRRARLMGLITNSQNIHTESTDPSKYHSTQILISLGTGSFSGVGFGQSKQKYNYLPEIASDSIFAVIGEEFGFMGTFFVMSMFGYLIYRGIRVSIYAPDMLGRLLSIGVISWIGIQFFINVAAMVRLIPLTGIPIPFLSYGGSSMIFTLMGVGVLANVEKSMKLR